MARSKGGALLVLLFLLCAAAGDECPSVSDNERAELTCLSDYNRSITCVWTGRSEENACTVLAEKKTWTTPPSSISSRNYNSSCKMEPVSTSTPRLKKCHLIFQKAYNFQSYHELSIRLSCKPTLELRFRPACHIKLHPPPEPSVVSTTVSWFPQAARHGKIGSFRSQLQWKAEAQAWTDPSVQRDQQQSADHSWKCSMELNPDQLVRGQRYEARVRVKAAMTDANSIWSDWSPVVSWDSSVGRAKPQATDLQVGVLSALGAAAALAVFLLLIHFKTDKATWFYMVKRITGPPLPDPAKSFLQDVDFQSWLSPHLPGGSLTSFSKPGDVVSMEVTSAVDAVAPCGLEVALSEKLRGESFSNPSYSHPAGTLAPCAADTPYAAVGGRDHQAEISLLLSRGCGSVPVVSDYERAEEVLVERARLQSLDSGVCSGEEVSQESLEADSINAAEGEEAGGGGGVDFRKLLAGGGSVPVCSGYERVPELLAGEEELKASSESTGLLLPRPPLPHILCRVALGPIALMSSGSPLEPCGDGYM